MKTRKLGHSDLELTTVGLGTWAIGGPWQFGWGPQDDDDSIATILKAIELGINWLDTAAIYGCGHSEEIVGAALKKLRRKPIVATKCGLLWDEKREKINCLKAKSIKKECDDSLKRLGVEVIDLYQMHWPQPDEYVEEAWNAMSELVKEGKVRYLGASNFKLEQLKRVQKIHPAASLQPPYSMIHRELEGELLDFCGKNKIGVIAYSPMQRGLLIGKFTKELLASLPPDDHRHKSEDFSEPNFSANLELVEKLKPIAKNLGITLSQLAIAWVLRKNEVTSAIVGARKPNQIEETVAGGDINLPQDDIEKIEKLLTIRQEKIYGRR